MPGSHFSGQPSPYDQPPARRGMPEKPASFWVGATAGAVAALSLVAALVDPTNGVAVLLLGASVTVLAVLGVMRSRTKKRGAASPSSRGIDARLDAKRQELAELEARIAQAQRGPVDAYADFGLYEPKFDFANSTMYADALRDVRERQKAEIARFNEGLKHTNWTVNGKASEGRKMVTQLGKLAMIAFNGESDELVRKVKAANVNRCIEQVRGSAATINRCLATVGVSIPTNYVYLKEEEIQLAYEFACAKDAEKEAVREAKAREREEAKLMKEIEEARKKLQKERAQYEGAYRDVAQRLRGCTDPSERADLEAKARELQGRLADVERAVADVDYRQANQRAGYVYVISNVGSFGEGVYKIGMTRRLEPMERIAELSDASVPFAFDVHALIFSDDAPALEAALHRAFEARKVNLVNQRREFFRVGLDEIKREVMRNHDRTVEFVDEPDAEQWRVSEQMRRASRSQQPMWL